MENTKEVPVHVIINLQYNLDTTTIEEWSNKKGVFSLIPSLSEYYHKKEKAIDVTVEQISPWVDPRGEISNFFGEDLEMILRYKKRCFL